MWFFLRYFSTFLRSCGWNFTVFRLLFRIQKLWNKSVTVYWNTVHSNRVTKHKIEKKQRKKNGKIEENEEDKWQIRHTKNVLIHKNKTSNNLTLTKWRWMNNDVSLMCHGKYSVDYFVFDTDIPWHTCRTFITWFGWCWFFSV